MPSTSATIVVAEVDTNNASSPTDGSRFVSNGPEMSKILHDISPMQTDPFLANLDDVQ